MRASPLGLSCPKAKLKWAVWRTPDGSAGLKLLAGHPEIRLLITDARLPGGMSGRQLADQARLLSSDLKVLFISGYTRNAIVQGRLMPEWSSW